MREMKDSGIAWIGKIPNNWTVERINIHLNRKEPRNPGNKEILSVYREYGVIPKSSRDDNHNVTSLDTSKYKYVKPGNLVINKMKAWQGSMGVSKYEGVVSPAYFIYHFIDNQLYKEYIHLLLRNCYKDEFRRISGGIREGQWDLSPFAFERTKLIIPPYQEQQAIADFLDDKCADIDSLTGDIQKQIEILKEYKKSVITQAVTKGIDPNVKMKDTVSPYWNQIPMNWYLSDIKYVFEIVKRIAGKEGYDILSVTQKGLKIKDISHNEGQIAENYKGYQFVYPGDFVMNHMDLLTGWVDLSKLFGVTSPDYRVFKLRDNHVNEARYYKYVMQCCYSCRIFYSLGQGVSTLGRWRLQTSAFNNFLIPVSPIKEQLKIADFLDTKCAEIDAAIAGKQKQLDVLKEYKKSLIYEYVTGKKEVPCRE